MRHGLQQLACFRSSLLLKTHRGTFSSLAVNRTSMMASFGTLLSCRALSTNAVYEPNFTPQIQSGGSLVIPISMGRYGMGRSKRKEYDEILMSLFSHTARLLEEKTVERVDVISTAGLQRINWDDERVQEVESYFFDTHKEILAQQTNCYRWDEWIDQKGRDQFNQFYQEITQRSGELTEWYELMVKTHDSVKMSSNLNASLEYQRREYAGVMLMSDYDHLIYTGHISLAWSYMYHAIHDLPLPMFTRAGFDKKNKTSSLVSTADANHTTRIILSMIEQTLTSSNFPNSEKQKIISMGMSLFYAYEPREQRKASIESQDGNEFTGQEPRK